MLIDFQQFKQHILSIHLRVDGFYFEVLNDQAEVLYHDMWETDETTSPVANLKKALEEKEWLAKEFRQVLVRVDTPRYIAAPGGILNESQYEDCLTFSLPSVSNEKVIAYALPNRKYMLAYGIDQSLEKQIKAIQPKAVIVPTVLPLLLWGLRKKGEKDAELHVWVSEHCLVFMGLRQQELLLLNQVEYAQQSDIPYFITSTWTALKMDQQTDHLLLHGEAGLVKKIMPQLSPYIRLIESMEAERDMLQEMLATL